MINNLSLVGMQLPEKYKENVSSEGRAKVLRLGHGRTGGKKLGEWKEIYPTGLSPLCRTH